MARLYYAYQFDEDPCQSIHEQQAHSASGVQRWGTLGIFKPFSSTWSSLFCCELIGSTSSMAPTLISNLVAEPTLSAGIFASLGVSFHLSILSREIDNASGSLLIVFFLVWAGLVIVLLKDLVLSVLSACLRASLACFTFLLALGLSTVIHRLFLHRLRHFPGPLGPKLSRFWTVRLVKSSNFKYHVELEKLHQTYGDFVRTGSYPDARFSETY